jgi:diadenosine tetraphosphate (Ap4A) HIT family hydrolase
VPPTSAGPADCAICHVAAQTTDETAVHSDEHFTVGTGMDVPGWLLLWTNRHEAQGLWELDDREAHALGPLLRTLAAALKEECRAERAYIMAMGEHALHFHAMVMARPEGAAPEARGPGLLSAAASLADREAAQAVAARIRTRLQAG